MSRRPLAVVAAWVLLAAVLNVFVPQLERVVAANSTPFLPPDSQMQRGLSTMDDAFGTGESNSYVFVVLINDHGLNAADQHFYERLVHRLGTNHERVAEVQEYSTNPQLKQALTSQDGRASYIPVGLRHELGTPPSLEDVQWMRQAVRAESPPPGLQTSVTGDAAMVADLNAVLLGNVASTTMLAAAIIVIILLLIYRRLVTVLIPLATIGVGVLCTRGHVAFLGVQGMPVSTYTDAFLVAVALGAGTDYSIFVISRYQEHLASGEEPRQAARAAVGRIRGVLAASAATIIIASSAMAFAELALFRTTGPAIAMAAGITVLVGLTLTPALLVLAGRRAAAPSGDRTRRWWERTGSLVARRPAPVLGIGMVILLVFAAFLPTLRLSFDESALQPASSESNVGYRALASHFPRNELQPDYLLIVADHDMRNPRDVASLDEVTRSVSKVPGVAAVRSVSRPLGKPLPEASLAHQLGGIGDQLSQAGGDVQRKQPDMGRLSGGVAGLADGAKQLAQGSHQATQGVDLFLQALHAEQQGLGTAADRTGEAADGAKQLSQGARVLAEGLSTARDQTALAVRGLGQIHQALESDPLCTVDPVCKQSREALGRIHEAQRDQLIPGLGDAANGARKIADGNSALAQGIPQLRDGLVKARDGVTKLAEGERLYQSRLGELAHGADQLAQGTAQLPPNIDQLISATEQFGRGMNQAGGHLRDARDTVGSAGTGGVYLPGHAIDDPRFALARNQYLSHDGHVARLVVIGDSPPVESAGRARFHQVQETARFALRGTPISNAHVMPTGAAAVGDDLSNYLWADAGLVVLLALAAVLLVLMITLRAVVAPLYLLASVVLSYAATMGITTLVWQHLLGQPIEWTVPIISFVVLVAVGADYNILLASRIREEGSSAGRGEIARAVAATGGVITSAGLIFAGSFVAFVPSPVIGLAENGFAIAVGLLLDTFVVRTLLVPSAAALLGRWNWWPGGRIG